MQDRAYYIADSAFYTEKNLQILGQHTFWISHVPAILSLAKSLLATEIPMVPGQDPGYSFHECLMDYGGIPQKWVLVSSEKGRQRQEKTFERVGGTRQITVDVRVIAATNRNLKRLVADGGFREDLYYRLNVLEFHLPPLRERLNDIIPLASGLISTV